jgi:hypothetical protein
MWVFCQTWEVESRYKVENLAFTAVFAPLPPGLGEIHSLKSSKIKGLKGSQVWATHLKMAVTETSHLCLNRLPAE